MMKLSANEPPDELYLFHALMENTADSIYFKDRDCRLVRVSRKMASSLGFKDPEQLVGKDDCELYGEEFGLGTRRDDLRVMDTGRPIIGLIEGRLLDNGTTNWTLASKLPLRDESGIVVGLMGITREINEMRQTEVALQHLATHDSLTDLPNRFLMIDRMNQVIARSQRLGTTFAVLFMDIDRFKEVNDTHGHEFGDLLLRAVGQRLRKSVRQSDTVARIGGDEFVIILDTVRKSGEGETVANHVRRSLAKPITVLQHAMTVTASIGISFYPENGESADMLMRAADSAMYLAKKGGGNRPLFWPGTWPS